MAAVREAVRQSAFEQPQHVVNRPRQHHARQRQVAAGHALGEDHQVRHHPVVLHPEPFAGPAKAGDHLVGDQQDPVAIADRAHAREVVGRRHDQAARPLHRLGDHRGDRLRAGVDDHLLQGLGVGLTGLHPRSRVVAVGIGRGRVQEARRQRLHVLPEDRQPGGAGGPQRQPVVVAEAGDDVDAPGLPLQLPVQPGQLVGGVVGLGAAGSEEGDLQVARRQFGQACRQPDSRCVTETVVSRVEGEVAHLRGRRVGQLGPPVADIHVPEPGHGVDVGPTGQVDQRGA